jgi:DNA-binding NtrC family response regulator
MSIKVLLVDDEEQFVKTLAQRLETRGFTVNVVFNGKDAIAYMQEHEVDVVILDVLMPEMDGIETLGQMKKINPIAEVIMLTGHATVETAIEGMKVGAFDYLMKPTEMQALVEKIEKAYARKAEHDERIRQAEIEQIIKRRGY